MSKCSLNTNAILIILEIRWGKLYVEVLKPSVSSVEKRQIQVACLSSRNIMAVKVENNLSSSYLNLQFTIIMLTFFEDISKSKINRNMSGVEAICEAAARQLLTSPKIDLTRKIFVGSLQEQW